MQFSKTTIHNSSFFALKKVNELNRMLTVMIFSKNKLFSTKSKIKNKKTVTNDGSLPLNKLYCMLPVIKQ